MNSMGARGFTIIETMLVLAITGLMVAGIFVGVGTQINVQRYRDAVETFKTTLQNQYAEISSVINDRDDTFDCTAGAAVSEGSTVRGQSDCVLVGRFVSMNAGSIRVASVLARPTATQATLSDINSLRDNYILNVASNSVQQIEMEWGTQIAWPRAGAGARNPTTPRTMSLLILRSPDSGQIYTFNSDAANANPTPATLRSMIIAGQGSSGGQRERIICIQSSELGVSGDRSIILAPYASVPNSFETSSNELLTQARRTTQC